MTGGTSHLQSCPLTWRGDVGGRRWISSAASRGQRNRAGPPPTQLAQGCAELRRDSGDLRCISATLHGSSQEQKQAEGRPAPDVTAPSPSAGGADGLCGGVVTSRHTRIPRPAASPPIACVSYKVPNLSTSVFLPLKWR